MQTGKRAEESALDLRRGVLQEVNKRIYEMSTWLGDARIGFLCECGRRHCLESVDISAAEYAQIKARGELVTGTSTNALAAGGSGAEVTWHPDSDNGERGSDRGSPVVGGTGEDR
jgi:hypothetical protein